MYSGPDAKQHGDDTGTQEVKSTTSRGTGVPADCISAVAEDQRSHVRSWKGIGEMVSVGHSRRKKKEDKGNSRYITILISRCRRLNIFLTKMIIYLS